MLDEEALAKIDRKIEQALENGQAVAIVPLAVGVSAFLLVYGILNSTTYFIKS